jgi:hypothetical protein
MSKDKNARDIALSEYNEFMEKYKAGVESGDMKLLQHMLRLEANKIRTQSILDAIEKTAAGIDRNVYDFEKTKMKMQMNSDEYRQDQAREEAFIKMATKEITKEQPPKSELISIGDPDQMDTARMYAMDFGQIITPEPAAKVTQQVPTQSTGIVIDPETGKKVYKGPALKSRRIIDGKVWDQTHPNFEDKGVGGM